MIALALYAALGAWIARADLLGDLPIPTRYVPGHAFTIVNEHHPERLAQALEKFSVPPGVLLSVGFERSFIGAATFPNVNGLVVLDFHSAIIWYSEINAALLKNNRRTPKDYVAFRLGGSDFARAQVAGFDPVDVTTFAWESNNLWKYYFGPEGALNPRVKYWTDPEARARLLQMAAQDRIAAKQVDLLDIDGRLPAVTESLKRRGERISLVDLSNAPEWIYEELGVFKGARALKLILETLVPAMHPDAVLLFSRSDWPDEGGMFSYHAIAVRELLTRPLDTWLAMFHTNLEFTPHSRSLSYLGKNLCPRILRP